MPHRWCSSAELRREQIESGIDVTFVNVFKPLFVEWICDLNPSRVVEIGAGTGHLSKALAPQQFSITAIEPSPGMYKVACEVLSGEKINLINCSSFDLPPGELFDVAFSHLVAHVVEDLDRFLASIWAHLPIGGHLVFSIPHPCFYNAYKKFFGPEYNYITPMTKLVSFSVTNDPDNVITDVPYHHRPISSYVNAIVNSGFAIDGFHEVYPPKDIQMKYGRLWDAPRYCAFVCKKL